MENKHYELSLHLPRELFHHAMTKVNNGAYTDMEDYIRDLMRRDLHSWIVTLNKKIEEGLKEKESGQFHDGKAVFKELQAYSKAWKSK